MIKKILIAVVAILCVAAVIITFNGANSTTYSGDNDNESMSMYISDNTFRLTHEVYESNSYNKTVTVYEGIEENDEYTVNKITVKRLMFGTLVSENVTTGMNKDLREYYYVYNAGGYLLIDNIPITSKGATHTKNLLCVTSIDQYENHTIYTTVLKGSTKADLASLGLVEIYGNGDAVRYTVTEDSFGDVDLDTIGVKDVWVSYGDNKTAKMKVEVVDFVCEINPLEPGTTLDGAIYEGSITVTPDDIRLTSPDWNSSEGDRMITLVSDSGYSKQFFINFVPLTDKEVVSYELQGFVNYIEQEKDLPAFKFSMVLKNGTRYDNISSRDATVLGYDRHTIGPQVLTVYYDKCAFNIALYVYNTLQSIPIDAELVNNSITPYIADGKILYDRDGISFNEYAIEITYTNGTKSYQPLTRDMISTPYNEWIVPSGTDTIPCTIHHNINGFHYLEAAAIVYDPLEENVKNSLTFEKMMEGCERMSYTATVSGVDTIWVAGYDSNGFYLASDMVVSSSYKSTYVSYYNTAGVNSFDYYLGSKTNEIVSEESMIKNAVMTGKSHTSDGIYTVSFHMAASERYSVDYSNFGFNAGLEYDFDVIYNFFTMKAISLNVKSECPLTKISFYYDPATVHYSDAVKNYMTKKNTVMLTVKYPDSAQRLFDVVIGTKEFNFICDEGHGLYKDPEGTTPYTVPSMGMNVSTTIYYV